jgi:spore photoproduct lyase
MNCSYCYLQSYINSPVSQIYTNIEQALDELDQISRDNPSMAFRVGTGETIDSLSHDDITLYSARLVEFFSHHPKLTCEFKTKTCNIKNFVNKNHAQNVVVSFSINPSIIVQSEEKGTASLDQRLSAARLARDKGFPVAFHIDPMIYIPDWQIHYSALAENVADMFKPSEVKWISLGALRYPPAMKNILRERIDQKSLTLQSELFLSDDGKLRYDQGLRNKMFGHVTAQFRKHDSKYPIFLCMESPESWLGTFEATPRSIETVADLFKPLKIGLDS